jgi:predicted phage terminase large subunit-like protein
MQNLQTSLKNEALRVLAKRELGRRYFSEFFKYQTESRGFVLAWFHKLIADKLQSVYEGDTRRLMIFVPPQHGKTTLSTELFPAWYLGKAPDTRIIVGAYSTTYSEKLNRAMQRVMVSPEYEGIFPDTRLNSKRVASDNQEGYLRNSTIFEVVNKIGSVRTTGRDGGVTGNPGDLMIFDDFIKNAEEANSGVLRAKMWEGYESDFETRMHNDTRVIFTITRWHEDDVAGRLLKRDGEKSEGGLWDVIRLEAIKETDFPYDIRRMGEALFPERHSLERLLKIQLESPTMFTSLYQQRPTQKTGNIIKGHYLKRYALSDLPPGINHCYIDTATSEAELKNGDPSGILIYRLVDNRLYLIDFFKGKWGMPDLIRNIKEVHARYLTDRQSKIFIENKSNGASVKQVLESGTNFSVLLEDPVGKKEERVELELPTLETGRVLVPESGLWVQPFIEQCMAFPLAKHDEEVDCLTGAIRTAFPKTPQAQPRKSAYR